MVKNRKSEHHHWIPHIQISLLVPNFCFNWQFWFFWPDLSKKGFSGLKQKKWAPHIFYIIVHIQINLVRNFSTNCQFWFFGPNLPKKIFPVENRTFPELDLSNLLTINSSPLHDLINSPHVKHPPKNLPKKSLFPNAKLFYEKSSPILCRGERRHYALSTNLFPSLNCKITQLKTLNLLINLSLICNKAPHLFSAICSENKCYFKHEPNTTVKYKG